MLFFMSVIYRSEPILVSTIDSLSLTPLDVVANYVYFDEGEDPTPDDITRSEMLESRMREGFVRVRQLLVCPP